MTHKNSSESLELIEFELVRKLRLLTLEHCKKIEQNTLVLFALNKNTIAKKISQHFERNLL